MVDSGIYVGRLSIDDSFSTESSIPAELRLAAADEGRRRSFRLRAALRAAISRHAQE
jgi:hypothetical protein